MGAHADGDSYQHIVGFIPAGGRVKGPQRGERWRDFCNDCGLLFDKSDICTLEDYDISELRRWLLSAILDDKQARPDNFKDKAPGGNCQGDSPDEQLFLVSPYTDVNPWLLYRRSEPGQQVCIKKNRWIELEWPEALFRRHERNG